MPVSDLCTYGHGMRCAVKAMFVRRRLEGECSAYVHSWGALNFVTRTSHGHKHLSLVGGRLSRCSICMEPNFAHWHSWGRDVQLAVQPVRRACTAMPDLS